MPAGGRPPVQTAESGELGGEASDGSTMNGYNFTDRVRKVLQMAREEAARLHHEYVGTEHILLGLIREGEGVAAAVLTNLNVDLDEIQQRIEETVKKGKAPAPEGPDLPYTSRAKKVLELAREYPAGQDFLHSEPPDPGALENASQIVSRHIFEAQHGSNRDVTRFYQGFFAHYHFRLPSEPRQCPGTPGH